MLNFHQRCNRNAYLFYVSFAGLGIGQVLRELVLGLGLVTAGLHYNTAKLYDSG